MKQELEGAGTMNIIDKIIEWSRTCPGWQRDAIRRLLAQAQEADGGQGKLAVGGSLKCQRIGMKLPTV